MKYYTLVNSDGKTINFFKTEKNTELIEISENDFLKLKGKMDDKHAELMKKSMSH